MYDGAADDTDVEQVQLVRHAVNEGPVVRGGRREEPPGASRPTPSRSRGERRRPPLGRRGCAIEVQHDVEVGGLDGAEVGADVTQVGMGDRRRRRCEGLITR